MADVKRPSYRLIMVEARQRKHSNTSLGIWRFPGDEQILQVPSGESQGGRILPLAPKK